MPLFKGINVVSVSVPDLDAARAFYRDTLGFGAPEYDLPEAAWIEFRTGSSGPDRLLSGGNLAVTLAGRDWQPNFNTTIVLNVDDCHAACDRLSACGVRCDEPVVFPGFVTFASFYDPFGNRLQMRSPAPE